MGKLADWFENETFWAEYAPIMFDTQRWAEAPTVAESILRIIGVPVDNAGISILDNRGLDKGCGQFEYFGCGLRSRKDCYRACDKKG